MSHPEPAVPLPRRVVQFALATVGVVQAVATLMGPITILFLGMSLVAIPEAARILRRSPRRLPGRGGADSGGRTLPVS